MSGKIQMHTVDSRKKIGFLKERKDWVKHAAFYDDHALQIAGHPVMEDWELEYMKLLAKIVCKGRGVILEVGYGMGLSAKAIQSHNVRKHYVIECHPDVIRKSTQDLSNSIKKNKIHILSGFWEEVTPLLKDSTFDGILFDTYPLTEEEIHKNHFWFFEEAYRLLKPGGILTYYSDEVKSYSSEHMKKLQEAGFEKNKISFKICKVNPPPDCKYWREKTILAPVITK